MELLTENYGLIITGLIAVAAAVKLVFSIPYLQLIKEVIDIYASYEKGKHGGFDDTEYMALGKEVVEAIESAKALKKVK